VILEDGKIDEPALGYRNAAGAFVHRPMPAEYAHEPITDAEVPCPVCGSVQYDQWRAGRGRKGTDSFEAHPLIVCRVCGHQEHVGGIVRFGVASADEDEAARMARIAGVRAEQAVQRWYADQMTLMGVTFPIYAAEGWPAQINGSGLHGDKLTHLTIAHGETLPDLTVVGRPPIEIRTSLDPHQQGELAIASEAFASGIEADTNRPLTDGLSDAAATLWFRRRPPPPRGRFSPGPDQRDRDHDRRRTRPISDPGTPEHSLGGATSPRRCDDHDRGASDRSGVPRHRTDRRPTCSPARARARRAVNRCRPTERTPHKAAASAHAGLGQKSEHGPAGPPRRPEVSVRREHSRLAHRIPTRAVIPPRRRYDGAYVPPRCCPGSAVWLGLASTSDLTRPSVR